MSNYAAQGLLDLGELASEKIRLYFDTRQETYVNDIYEILVEMGTKLLHSDYKGLDFTVIEETSIQVSEDILIQITKHPERFLHHDNFFYYYRSALRNQANSTLKYLYTLIRSYVNIEDMPGSENFSVRNSRYPRAEYILDTKDNMKLIVKSVILALTSTPRFSKATSFLMWPLVTCMLKNSDELFSSLSFRDRTALRVVLIRSMKSSSRKFS
jgi:hypothetical protein